MPTSNMIVSVIDEFLKNMITPYFVDHRRGSDNVYYWHMEDERGSTLVTIYLNNTVLDIQLRNMRQFQHLNLADPGCFEQVEKLYREYVIMGANSNSHQVSGACSEVR